MTLHMHFLSTHGKTKIMITLKLKIQDAGGGGAFVEIPDDVVAKLGQGKKRIKVHATYDGVPYRGLITPYSGHVMLGILKDIREKIGKKIGDTVIVTLVKDEEERVLEIPEELQKVLNRNKKAKEFFEGLSFTNRKEYAVWISGAKREETKAERLKAVVDKLLKGKKNPSEK